MGVGLGTLLVLRMAQLPSAGQIHELNLWNPLRGAMDSSVLTMVSPISSSCCVFQALTHSHLCFGSPYVSPNLHRQACQDAEPLGEVLCSGQ